ncbi:MAG: hypothetical protein GYB26_02810 [Gammaproteobacteria bacterium]|uniref:Uncharacterized protein n=1 Tax=Marinobacter litoralis TaxID=187981 RepID=A0A3M2RL82_9GAMM|nr:hypothetical protein [Marinobacter litoralis]MBR9870052.1 hypothetical protein [Gammaproteobacteria bacterium]RMJ06110.1 hypothetical protein DOQ08_00794 [Marinobacter litoralis]
MQDQDKAGSVSNGSGKYQENVKLDEGSMEGGQIRGTKKATWLLPK